MKLTIEPNVFINDVPSLARDVISCLPELPEEAESDGRFDHKKEFEYVEGDLVLFGTARHTGRLICTFRETRECPAEYDTINAETTIEDLSLYYQGEEVKVVNMTLLEQTINKLLK